MKPACYLAGRAWVRRIVVNYLPSIESSVIPQWLLQISISPLCFQNGSITPYLQSPGSSSLIQTSSMIWMSQWVTLTSPTLRSSAVMLLMPGLWPFFISYREAATSASVTGCIQMSVLSSLASLLGKSSLPWGSGLFRSCWKCSFQQSRHSTSVVRMSPFEFLIK